MAALSLPAREAYDAFAERYDNWKWQRFWHLNEWPYIKKLIASSKNASSILDVGTGTGYYLSNLQQTGRFLCGVDISFRMLRLARMRLDPTVQLLQAEATALPFSPRSFDIVVINRVASHVAHLDLLAAELQRVLRDDGRLIVSDIAPEHDYPATEFRTSSGWVSVETYKHSINDWQQVYSPGRLDICFTAAISAANAKWLPKSFTSIDLSGRRSIGFVVAFDKKKRLREPPR